MFRTKKEVLKDISGFARSNTGACSDFVKINHKNQYPEIALNIVIDTDADRVLPLLPKLSPLFVRRLPSAHNARPSHGMLESTNG
jgi:hypothetical protein